jgi:serine/threonine protein kinase
MFKIGNSKELPVIPDSLSREGKEFVRLCLQRDPANRPTAAQLLEHPFVAHADTLGGADLLPSPAIRPVVSNSRNLFEMIPAYRLRCYYLR